MMAWSNASSPSQFTPFRLFICFSSLQVPLNPSALSATTAVTFLPTGVTRQPRPASGLRSAPDQRQSVTYAGTLFEYAVRVCARVCVFKENRQVFLADYILFFQFV